MSAKQMGMVWDLDLPQNLKFVLLAYADHADHDGGSVYPSLQRIADKTGYSRRQVIRIAQDIVKRGLMERVTEATHDHPAVYQLHLDRGDKLSPHVGGGVTSATQRGDIAMSPEPSLEPSVNTSKDVDAGASASDFVSLLAEELDGNDVPLMDGRKGRYGKDFKRLLDKGVAPDVLYKVCDRIVEAWNEENHRKLTPEQAMQDVVNGKAPAHVTQPPTPTPPSHKSNSDILDSYLQVTDEDRKRNQEIYRQLQEKRRERDEKIASERSE